MDSCYTSLVFEEKITISYSFHSFGWPDSLTATRTTLFSAYFTFTLRIDLSVA
jgi:hypothetical protein